MIAGALGGAALAAWLVVGAAAHRHARLVRRRLVAAEPAARRGGAAVTRGPHTTPAGEERRPRWRQPATPGRQRHPRPRRPGPGRRRSDVAPGQVGDGDLAEACTAIARSLRSGASLASAVIEAAGQHPVPDLAPIARAAQLGEPLTVAIERGLAAVTDPDARLVVQVLGVAAEHGGSQAEAIDRAAATLRERAALRAERSAQAASARISTRVMTILPLAFTGFVAASDADVRDVLLGTPVGWGCLTVGIALNLGGRAWARRAVGA